MDSLTEEYRGYTITVTPLKDHEDLWDFEYHIAPVGDTAPLDGDTQSQTLGGHATPQIALLSGFELAKTEIDNRLALAASN
jgi:hypothetical protein